MTYEVIRMVTVNIVIFDAAYSGRIVPTFQSSALPPSSRFISAIGLVQKDNTHSMAVL